MGGSHMEINQLRYFVAAAQESSFAKAAERCFTTRQNVSRSIKDLEAELQAPLFVRRGNAMTLTPVGDAVLQQAQTALDAVEGMKAICSAPAGPKPHVSITISHNLFSGVPAMASDVIEKYVIMDQIMELSTKECYERVCAREVDVSIVTAMERDFPGCRSREIARMAPYLLVSAKSPLARKTHYTIKDLKGLRFVLMPDSRFQYGPLFDLLEPFGLEDRQVSSVTSTGSMLHIIKRIDAGAIVTDTYYASAPAGTVAIPINEPSLSWRVYMLYTMNPSNYLAIDQLARELKESMGS